MQGAAPFARTREAVESWLAARDALVAASTRVYVYALGKASPSMAAGAVQALRNAGMAVHGGVIVAAHQPTERDWHGTTMPDTMVALEGDHPVPGPRSLAAAMAMDDCLQRMEPDALAVVLLSGGTTALCAAPIGALIREVGDAHEAQAHLANLAQTLLESGLAIHEMNAIRRRVLQFGAGRLATSLAGCGVRDIATFAISDVIGDDPAVIGSGPCTPDPLDDATFLALLDAHDMRTRLQRSMATVLGLAGASTPPPVPHADHPAFGRVTYTLVARNSDAVAALAHAAIEHGITDVVIEQTPLEGDAAVLGDMLARRALTLARTVPRDQQTLLVMGGEPVVHLRDTIERAMEQGDDDAVSADEPLRGGRMQVLALSAALALEEAAAHHDPSAWRITILAAGTDGRDGPTDAAGAIVDAAVPALARRAGREPERDLITGHSWFPLDAASALLRTGPTGTNVMDVVAVLITA